MSTRDNRIAAESVGINITKYKLLAFTISAALAGVAGALYAHNLSLLKVSVFDYNMSIHGSGLCSSWVVSEISVDLLLQPSFFMLYRSFSVDLQIIVC